MKTESKISKDQLRKLWVTAREAGLDKTKVYDLVLENTGSESISSLSSSEAKKVIESLNLLRVNLSKRKPKDPLSILQRKLQKRSYEQSEMAKVLCGKINEKGVYTIDLEEFSLRQYRKPFSLLTRGQASGLIQGLKAILEKSHG
ncbi:hypothetical protein [Leptospira licerasiae]|uniref:DUF1018 domain-containing protein n=1 Tax=Leptospira licerasiae str. MMD4847 TaxID=1049971 RepID=A0ABN0HBD2_9LEPT|nr:hypothetical protein [Leptospira licerasiae]EJZ42912.1 hypothetical protein LEP1GSC178_3595 [Leptospira licerasiae str. MMD4847]